MLLISQFLHYTTLHYTTLRYATLHYTTLRYATLHYTTLHYTTLHYAALRKITLYYTMLPYITLHYVISYLLPNFFAPSCINTNTKKGRYKMSWYVNRTFVFLYLASETVKNAMQSWIQQERL